MADEPSRRICGHYKIIGFPLEDAIKLAKSWKEGPCGERYISLEVRCSSEFEQVYTINFTYLLNDRERLKDFIHNKKRKLYKRFGHKAVRFDVTATILSL